MKKIIKFKLENEVVIFLIVLKMILDNHTKDSQKNPPYTNSDYSSLKFVCLFCPCPLIAHLVLNGYNE
jgi:hypothetical protein